MTDSFALYKLIILYMLKKVDFPLTTAQISEFILDKGYTSFFKLQETLSEMLESNLVKTEETHNRTLYHLTKNGEETIHFFQDRISPSIQKDIDDFLAEKAYDLKEEVSVKSNYYMNTNHEYDVVCKITEEEQTLIELKLCVPTEKEAESIASNWTKYNQEIYTSLLSKLL